MTEVSSLVMRLSPRPIKFSHTTVTAPAGDMAPLVGGDLVYTAFFQNPTDIANTVDPTTVPFNEAIKVQGVATDVSSIEGFWKRPGFQETFLSLGQLSDLGGGNWEIASGFEAIIFESGVDHGSAPWTDIDFVAKLVSPQGVSWTATIDTNISHVVPAPNTIIPIFEPGFEDDCLTIQSSVFYYLQAGSDVTDLDWSNTSFGIASRWDLKADWATGVFWLFYATNGVKTVQMWMDTGTFHVHADGTSDLDASFALGKSDGERWQLYVNIDDNDSDAVWKIRMRDPAVTNRLLENTSGTTTLVSGVADAVVLDIWPDMTTISIGGPTQLGRNALSGTLYGWWIQKSGTVLTKWDSRGVTDISGLDGDDFLDKTDTPAGWTLEVEGSSDFSICWLTVAP